MWCGPQGREGVGRNARPGAPGRRRGGLGLCATQWCILPTPVWFLNSSGSGTRPKAPGARPCYLTHSPSAPQKLKAGHPSPPPKGELKAQGLAWRSSVYRVHSLLFTDGNCGRAGSLPRSRRHTRRGAPPGLRTGFSAGPFSAQPRRVLAGGEARYPLVAECEALSAAPTRRRGRCAPGQS